MEVAGRVADGVVLAEGAGPTYVRAARAQAGNPAGFRTSVFSALCIEPERRTAYRWMAQVVAGWLGSSNPPMAAHPHADEIHERVQAHGADGLLDMPREWWLELGAIGTFDDVVEHLELLADAGVHDVALFPAPELHTAREQIDDVVRLAAALR